MVGGALPLLARAARDDRERLSYALQRIFEVSLILGVAAALGMLAGADFVIEVIAGPKYAGSVVPLQLLGVAMIPSFVIAGWSFAMLSLERYKGLLLANLAALLVSCCSTAVLASAHGARGSAVASARHRGALPRASAPPARPAARANVCSVRRGCLSITTASAGWKRRPAGKPGGAVRRSGIGWLRRLRWTSTKHWT